MLGVHPDLRRYTALAFFSSGLVGIAGVALLVMVAVKSSAVDEIPMLVALLFCAVSLVVAYLGVVITPRWYRNATRVVTSERPVAGAMTLRIDKGSDSTALYARLYLPHGPAPDEEIALLFPRWDVKRVLAPMTRVSVYRDPDSSDVVAIETSQGRLWSRPPLRRSD